MIFVAIAASRDQVVVLLRLNPDGYTDEHGKHFPPCFKLSKSGKVTVDPAQQKQWGGRLANLGERVRFFLDPSNTLLAYTKTTTKNTSAWHACTLEGNGMWFDDHIQ